MLLATAHKWRWVDGIYTQRRPDKLTGSERCDTTLVKKFRQRQKEWIRGNRKKKPAKTLKECVLRASPIFVRWLMEAGDLRERVKGVGGEMNSAPKRGQGDTSEGMSQMAIEWLEGFRSRADCNPRFALPVIGKAGESVFKKIKSLKRAEHCDCDKNRER